MDRRSLLLLACAALAATSALSCGADPASGASASFPADPLMSVASQSAALQIQVRTAPDQPPARGVISVEYRITHADGSPADGLEVSVVPFMPEMGHGASVTPSVVDMGGGRYVVSDVELFMPGRWELRTTFAGPAQDSATPSIQIP